MSKRFYSGFSLSNDADFFKEYMLSSEYAVSGFSYGAIKAAEYAAAHKGRIDLLQLFSPAFFQNRPEKYKRMQMMGFKKDASGYISLFRANSFAPYPQHDVDEGDSSEASLRELLYYEWKPELLHRIIAKGTKIEIYVGGRDEIIDPKAVRDFFLPYATVYTITDANHFLQENQT